MITREKFKRFLEVQASGVCNMWSREVERLADLTRDECLEIISHYKVYKDVYDMSVDDFRDWMTISFRIVRNDYGKKNHKQIIQS